MSEILALHNGRILENVHDNGTCIGDHCCVHNPSEHPLNRAPLDWWWEFRHMVRVCEHGVSHPDPDDLVFKQLLGEWITVEAICSVHLVEENCDGCCQSVPGGNDVAGYTPDVLDGSLTVQDSGRVTREPNITEGNE